MSEDISIIQLLKDKKCFHCRSAQTVDTESKVAICKITGKVVYTHNDTCEFFNLAKLIEVVE